MLNSYEFFSTILKPYVILNLHILQWKEDIMTKATFAAGCFWGIEAIFRKVPGVIDVIVGYTGGQTKNPTYKEVCCHATGHAEAVEIDYDPNQVTYEQLLDIFWRAHTPTQLNRQGPDIGSQYRSAIFFHSPEQEQAAIASKQAVAASGIYKDPIVTEITPATIFYKAEEYHQRYVEKHPNVFCHAPLRPKE
jgi:peptide-methionine (S)-S-oxide reductase